MKKLLFLILFISLSFLGHSQYNITQNLGGPTTLVQNPNYGGFRGGLIPYTFSDTTSANSLASLLKLYNGALIYCTADNAVYWRDATNQKWVQLLPSGGTGGLSAWLTTGNFAVPTDVNGYAKFGTFGTNGINVITSGNTVFKIHADGIVPDTGTVQGLGVNSYGELSYFSGGGGSTPTWQQTLTAGSTLNISNNINSGNNTQSFSWPTLGGGNLGMYISSESSTAATGGEILLQVTTTHTPVATGITTYSADIQNSSIGTNLTNIALMAGATEGVINIAAWFNRGKVRFGTSGTESGILDIVGATSGTITFQPQSAAGTYNWNWPTTAGTSGYLLTSAGGGSSAMTWTDPSTLAGANTALSNLSSVAVNTSILPGTTNSIALGSTAKIWSDVQSDYFHTGGLSATYGGYSGAILGGTATHAVLDFFDNNTRVAELYTTSTSANFYTNTASAFNFYTNNSLSTAVMTFSGGQNVLIGGSTDPTSAVSALGIYNGTAPTGSIVNGTILYSEDVAASSELKVRDEAGNITVLSPHHFLELGKPSEEQAWSYYSEKDGKYITVDMTKAIRTIEELTQRVYLLEKQLGIEATKPVKLIFKGKVKK